MNMLDSCNIWFHESSNFIELFREERWKFDQFVCIRDFFKEINGNFAFVRTPLMWLATDEKS